VNEKKVVSDFIVNEKKVVSNFRLDDGTGFFDFFNPQDLF
jgi:hypothetical protein